MERDAREVSRYTAEKRTLSLMYLALLASTLFSSSMTLRIGRCKKTFLPRIGFMRIGFIR